MKNLKKIFTFACLLLCTAVFFACSDTQSSPSRVAEESIKLLQAEKYDDYVKLLYLPPEDMTEEKKADYAATCELVKVKLISGLSKNKGIKSYTLGEEKLNETGDEAEVSVKIVYGNGEEKSSTIRTCKDKHGKWWLNDF